MSGFEGMNACGLSARRPPLSCRTFVRLQSVALHSLREPLLNPPRVGRSPVREVYPTPSFDKSQKSGHWPISPLVGEMPTGRGGRDALQSSRSSQL
jgi:hypothetical protein